MKNDLQVFPRSRATGLSVALRRAVVISGIACATQMSVHAQSSAFWTGAVDSDYTNIANWDIGALPTSATAVTLAATAKTRVVNLSSSAAQSTFAVNLISNEDTYSGATLNLSGTSAIPLVFNIGGDGFQTLSTNTNESNRPDIVVNAGSNTRINYSKSTAAPSNGQYVQLHLSSSAVLDISAVGSGAAAANAYAVEFRQLSAEAGTTMITGDNILRFGGAQRYGIVEIAGAIDASGGGSIYKTGHGMVVLSGQNTFTATATSRIQQGTLVVNGNAGNVTLAIDGSTAGTGTLSGTGVVGNVILTQGYVSAGFGRNSSETGRLSTGNFAQTSASSYLWVDLGAKGSYDQIAATGTATIGSGSRLTLAAAAGQLFPGNYTILSASGGITGTYTLANMALPASQTITFAAPQVVGNDLVLTLTQSPFSDLPALSSSQQVVAGYLDSLYAAGDPLDPTSFSELLGVMNAKASMALLTSAMNQLTPQSYGHLFTGAVSGLNTFEQGTISRFDRAIVATKDLELYATVGHDMAETNDSADAAPASLKAMHYTVGAERGVGERLLVGGAVEYISGDYILDATRSNASITGYTGSLYAAYKTGKISVGAVGFLGFDDFKVDRNISETRLGNTVQSESDGERYGAGVWASYATTVSWFNIKPYVTTFGMNWSADPFNETGAGDLVMNVAKQSETYVQSRVGVRIDLRAEASNSRNGTFFQPFIDVSGVHQWNAGERRLKAVINGYSMNVLTPDTKADAIRGGVGCAMAFSESFSVEVSATGQFDGLVDHQFGFNGSISYRF